MTETINQVSPQPEIRPMPNVKELAMQTVDLPKGLVLRDKDEARARYNLNGAVLAEITLPIPIPNGKDERRLALVDFGEEMPENGHPLYYYVDKHGAGQELGGIKIKSRFALVGLNYVPEGLLAAVAELPEGGVYTFGREDDSRKANYKLGLTEDKDLTLSRQHFTVAIDGLGNVSIGDQSVNHTKLTVPVAVSP